MNIVYIIYLTTFLLFPILGFMLSRRVDIKKYKKYIIGSLLFFGIHNLLFFIGISFKGDYSDYIIFSLEYLFLILVTLKLNYWKNIYVKVFRMLGIAVVSLGFLQAIIGIVLFAIIAQDYTCDKIYNSSSNKKNYQIRRYSFGFATLIDTKYTYTTYRQFDYLPFEQFIHTTVLYGLSSKIDLSDNTLKVEIKESNNKKVLEFSSLNDSAVSIKIDEIK